MARRRSASKSARNGIGMANLLRSPLLNQIRAVPRIPPRVTLSETWYYYEKSKLTPFGRTWKSPQGTKFFLEFKIEIPTFHATLVVTSLVDGQDFPIPLLKADTYEGVAKARGTFMGHATHGTAWNEQQPAADARQDVPHPVRGETSPQNSNHHRDCQIGSNHDSPFAFNTAPVVAAAPQPWGMKPRNRRIWLSGLSMETPGSTRATVDQER